MTGQNLIQQLRRIASELQSLVDAQEVPMSVAEMTKRITDTLGTGETAHRLRVDPSTVISWRNGNGITKSNLKKLIILYEDLFGDNS